jgi:hypothetical protein
MWHHLCDHSICPCSPNILGILEKTWRRIKFCIHDLRFCPASMVAQLLNLLFLGFFIKGKMSSQSLVGSLTLVCYWSVVFLLKCSVLSSLIWSCTLPIRTWLCTSEL